jgi:hypothetical protein
MPNLEARRSSSGRAVGEMLGNRQLMSAATDLADPKEGQFRQANAVAKAGKQRPIQITQIVNDLVGVTRPGQRELHSHNDRIEGTGVGDDRPSL